LFLLAILNDIRLSGNIHYRNQRAAEDENG